MQWRQRGVLLLVMGIWGLNLPVLKWLTGYFDVVLLAGLRIAAGSLVLFCLLRPAAGRTERSWPPCWWLLAGGFLTIYAYQLLVTEGVRRSSATNSALVTALHPILAAAVGYTLLRERLSGRCWVGAVLGLAGVVMVVLQSATSGVARAGEGELLLALGLVLYCGGAILMQQLLQRWETVFVSVAVHSTGAALLLAQVILGGWVNGELPTMPPFGWPWVILLISGALSTGVAGLLWNSAVSKDGASRVSMWLSWVPIFGIAAAALLLGEPLTWWHLAGLMFVLLGTHLSSSR